MPSRRMTTTRKSRMLVMNSTVILAKMSRNLMMMNRKRKYVRCTHTCWLTHKFYTHEHVKTQSSNRLPIKKRLIFPGKTMKKTNAKKKKKKMLPKLEDDSKTDKSSYQQSPSKQRDIPDELETEKTIRKSTRTSVIVRQAEWEAIRAEKEATMKPILKKKKEGDEKRMKQRSSTSEILNVYWQERRLRKKLLFIKLFMRVL